LTFAGKSSLINTSFQKLYDKIVVTTEINPTELLNELLEYYVKYKPTWNAFIDFIKLINKSLSCKILPETKHLLLKVFSNKSSATYHLMCIKCKQYGFKYQLNTSQLPFYECFNCHHQNTLRKPQVVFVTFPILPLLKGLIEAHGSNLIYHHQKQDSFPICDIFNGIIYNQVINKNGPCLVIGTNTDGIKRFISSLYSLWPLFISLYNIPPHLRLKEENIATAALFCGKQINMDYFYENFVEELEAINKAGGIDTIHGKIPVYCILASLDSTARPKLQQHNQFNGFYGCSFCYSKGESIGGSLKYPYR
jgi:hypothetical protein